VHERTAIADEVIALTQTGVEATLALEPLALRALDALEVGDVGTASLFVDRYVRLAEVVRGVRPMAIADLLRAMRALLHGDLGGAERLLERALERRPPSDLNNAAIYAAMQRFLMHRERGRLAEVEPALSALARQLPHVPLWPLALAVVHADDGHLDQARRELAAVAGDRFADLRVDCNWLPTLVLAAEVASAVGDRERAALVYDLLAPYADRWAVFGIAIACMGAVDHSLGLLASTLGRHEDAALHLDRALAAYVRTGAAVLQARAQVARARAASAAGDTALASRCRTEAKRAAETLGLRWLAEAAEEPTEPAGAAGVPTRRAAAAPGRATLRREGDYWTLAYGDGVVRLKDTKGVHYLATLVANPGRDFHVLELAAGDAPDAAASGADAVAAGLRAGDLGDAGELLDPAARRAYQRRAAELREELDEAESFHDAGRAERARHELEFLAGELARGVGLGGRDRKAASAAERARQNVSRAILVVVRKIAADLPALGEHLQATVRTGVFCSYTPDGRVAIAWNVA
jgi:tetratricopeptide (TPR) repeat protein